MFNSKLFSNFTKCLQGIGVSESVVSDAIKIVAETACNAKFATELPSRQTQARFASEMKALSREQINEHLESTSNTTLKYDGTTKRRVGHLVECEIASDEQTFLIGVKQQAGGTADEYIDAINDSVSAANPDILKNISNTMTDRAAVNTSIDNKLSNITEKPINSFRCGMHPLDTLAKACDHALNELDQPNNYPRLYKRRGESSVACLLRKVCDLFHNESTGCAIPLSSYLRSVNCCFTSTPRYVGGRFNILFESAKCVMHMIPSILNYFRKVTKPSNDLQSTVYQYMQCPHFQHSIICLATIYDRIAHPWMMMINAVDNILSVNVKYQEAVDKMCTWEQDPSSFLSSNNHCAIFGDVVPDISLLNLDDLELPLLCTISKKMLGEIIVVCKRQLADQLRGGIFWEPSEELEEAASSCSTTNMSGERQFAKVDALLHRAPNITVGKVEAKVMYSSNRTSEWLDQKSAAEREEKIISAMKKGKHIRKDDKMSMDNVNKSIKDRNDIRRRQLTEKETKQRSKVEEVIEQVVSDGVEYGNFVNNLENKSIANQKKYLIGQIRFREAINKSQKHALSKCSINDLKNILNEEVGKTCDESFCDIVGFVQNPEAIMNRNFLQKWEDESGIDTWWTGHVVSYSNNEFEIKYNEAEEAFFMTLSEIICDMLSLDLKFV